jgi:protein SCO1/2
VSVPSFRLIACLGLCCLMLSCERQAPVASPSPRGKHPLLDYAFTNELGKPITLGQLRGKALALTFIFTRCPNPDYCPRLSKNFQEAAEKLRATPGAPTNWHFLSVTFDTEYDTPAVLKAYAQRYNYDPAHWSFLTGPPDKIAELAALNDVNFDRKSGFYDHNFRTLIIDPAGALQMMFPITGDISDEIANEILKALAPPNQPAPSPGPK